MASIGVKVYLEGAAEYRKQMSEMTSVTKLYQAQMKNLQSQLGKSTFSKSIQESKLLSQQLVNLKEKSALLEKRIEEATTAYGENSKEVNRLKTQYEKLQAEINAVDADLKAHGGTLGAIGAQLQETGDKISAVGSKISGVGDKLTQYVTLPLAAMGAASLNAYKDWETAFTGVMKTVDETDTTKYADIADGIKKLATETASTKEEIAGVAEAAGQLGIAADDIIDFTKVMVELGDTTNLSADEAAIALARFLNITGESPDKIENIGSAIVALGNNFATSESEIVEMSTRLASAGTVAGLTSTDILALATAMSSVGINAEAGGTAMSQTLASLEKNVAHWKDGTKNSLDEIARIAGMGAEDFANLWESKPIYAVDMFIKGLGNLEDQGESAVLALDEIGMSGVRQSNMLKSLALASDVMTEALHTSSQAYIDNNALVDEASLRYSTFESKLSQTKEKIGNVAIEIGERLLPYVDMLIDKVDDLIQKWDEMDPATKDMIVNIGLVAAAVGPLLAIGGRLITGVGSLVNGIGQISSFMGTISASSTTLGAAIGAIAAPVAMAVAAIGALVAAFVYLYNTSEEFRAKAEETWASIQNTMAVAAEGMRAIWDTYGEGIMYVVQTVFDWLVSFIETYLTVIMDIIQFWMAFFRGDWEECWNSIVDIYTTIWEYIQNLFVTGFTFLQTVLTAALNFIKTKIMELVNFLKPYISAALTTIVTSVSTKFNEIKQKFTDLKTNITNIIKGLISDALHWGSDMVENFKNGITSKMSQVLDSVRNMANEIKSMMHFSEPDKGPLKHFNDWAPDMMKQYAQGIENGRYLVQRAVSDVTADVAMIEPEGLSADEIYSAVNAGASDANISIVIGDRELGRALRNMGVVIA